jgi:hypothetical protein
VVLIRATGSLSLAHAFPAWWLQHSTVAKVRVGGGEESPNVCPKVKNGQTNPPTPHTLPHNDQKRSGAGQKLAVAQCGCIGKFAGWLSWSLSVANSRALTWPERQPAQLTLILRRLGRKLRLRLVPGVH